VPVVQSVFGVGLPLAGLAVAVGGPHALALARAVRQLWRACRGRLSRASRHELQVQEGEWQRSLGAGVQPQAAGWEGGQGGRRAPPGLAARERRAPSCGSGTEAGVENPLCGHDGAQGVSVGLGRGSSKPKGGELDAVVDWDSTTSSRA
jgi:hypothetical protein